MGAVTENHHHHSYLWIHDCDRDPRISRYTVVTVIAAHPFLPTIPPQSATRSSNKVQVTLPPGPIQVGPERVYRQEEYSVLYCEPPT